MHALNVLTEAACSRGTGYHPRVRAFPISLARALRVSAALAVLGAGHALAGTVVSVGTASPTVIVVVIEAAQLEGPPSQAPASWLVDAVPPVAVGRWSHPRHAKPDLTPADALTMRHHLYLELSAPLVSGKTYELTTPLGVQSLAFDDARTPCESIKVNQVGYSGDSKVRRALLELFLGDLGARPLTSPVPYRVISADGAIVAQGVSAPRPAAPAVHALDLAAVPAGGPYRVTVTGWGASHPFGVGPGPRALIARVHARGLYHQRCGIALEKRFTDHDRATCHGTVQVTDAEPPGFIKLDGPARPIHGGWHDAGDFDRRPSHTIVPAYLLAFCETFPDRTWDGQLGIPESGNGIPDLLDEALWGVALYENLQEPDGGAN